MSRLRLTSNGRRLLAAVLGVVAVLFVAVWGLGILAWRRNFPARRLGWRTNTAAHETIGRTVEEVVREHGAPSKSWPAGTYSCPADWSPCATPAAGEGVLWFRSFYDQSWNLYVVDGRVVRVTWSGT